MEEAIEFPDARSCITYMNKHRLEPNMGARLFDYDHYYLLVAESVLDINGEVTPLRLCGTNHTYPAEPREKEYIDEILDDLDTTGNVLVEHGITRGGYVQDNILDGLRRKALSGETVEGVRKDTLSRQDMGEMTYAAEKACERDAQVTNFDLILNPKSAGILSRRYGYERAASRMKIELSSYFQGNEALSVYLDELFSEQGIRSSQERMILVPESDPCKVALFPPDYLREDYMAGQVLAHARSGPVFAVAHTMHIVEVISRLWKGGCIRDFSGRCNLNNHRFIRRRLDETSQHLYPLALRSRIAVGLMRGTNRIFSKM